MYLDFCCQTSMMIASLKKISERPCETGRECDYGDCNWSPDTEAFRALKEVKHQHCESCDGEKQP